MARGAKGRPPWECARTPSSCPSTEQEDFVRACVLLKAEIVNPGAPAADQYSRWDELTGLHRMIQNAFSPLGLGINFGHGGLGSYSFLSWHRYFLLHVELDCCRTRCRA